MKKVQLFALALVLVLVFAGCKRSNLGSLGMKLDEWADPVDSVEARSIEIETFSSADFGDELGFDVDSMPSEDQMKSYKYFIIDGWYGQVEYTSYDKKIYVVRMAKANERPLKETYTEIHALDEKTLEINGVEVTAKRSMEKCALVTWTKGDIQYTMHSNKAQGMPSDEDIRIMVQGLDCKLRKA